MSAKQGQQRYCTSFVHIVPKCDVIMKKKCTRAKLNDEWCGVYGVQKMSSQSRSIEGRGRAFAYAIESCGRAYVRKPRG